MALLALGAGVCTALPSTPGGARRLRRAPQQTHTKQGPVPPRPLTCGTIPQRLDLTDTVLQPLQPQAELQLLLPPVEAEGQVAVLGQSRVG